MGKYTPRFSLYKPDIGEVNWGDKINRNFDIIDENLNPPGLLRVVKEVTVKEDTNIVELTDLDINTHKFYWMIINMFSGAKMYYCCINDLRDPDFYYHLHTWRYKGQASYGEADDPLLFISDPEAPVQVSAIITRSPNGYCLIRSEFITEHAGYFWDGEHVIRTVVTVDNITKIAIICEDYLGIKKGTKVVLLGVV